MFIRIGNSSKWRQIVQEIKQPRLGIMTLRVARLDHPDLMHSFYLPLWWYEDSTIGRGRIIYDGIMYQLNR